MGPDQAGLCVVNACDVAKWSTAGVKSCDPLALLVVGKGCHEYGDVFNIPAHTTGGTPIIVQGCIIQYGDVPIEFNLRIPSVVVDQVASTAIEFTIYRSHVTCWDDVTVPLHYIGVHIPELRGSNLLATWSIKAWNKQQLSHVSKADHWHGFFRIADNLLCAVLGRSGGAGIFLNPKTSGPKNMILDLLQSPFPMESYQMCLPKPKHVPKQLELSKREKRIASDANVRMRIR